MVVEFLMLEMLGEQLNLFLVTESKVGYPSIQISTNYT